MIKSIYLPLSVNYADEPELRALCRFGADGLLARDLAVGMECYCRRNLTDGWVPREQAEIIAHPLPAEHVTKLVSHLETTLVIDVKPDGFYVRKYTAKYGTREETEQRAEAHRAAGRLGGRPSGKRAGRTTNGARANQVGSGAETKFPERARAKPETEPERKPPPYPPADSAPSTLNGGGGGGDLITQTRALMAVQGYPVDAVQAELIVNALVGGRDDIVHPAAYLASRISNPEQAQALAPSAEVTTAARGAPPLPPAKPKMDAAIADAMEEVIGGAISSGQARQIRAHLESRGMSSASEMVSAIKAAPDPRALLPPRRHVPGRTVAQALGVMVSDPPATREQHDKRAEEARLGLESAAARAAAPAPGEPADDNDPEPPF